MERYAIVANDFHDGRVVITPDGEWIRYEDHCEAMKRIAADGEAIGVVERMPGSDGFTIAVFKAEDVPIGTKLYAASRAALSAGEAQQGLTDAAILAVVDDCFDRNHYGVDNCDWIAFARAIAARAALTPPRQMVADSAGGAEKVCPACKGAGQISTGCDEFSESICKTCEGTGVAAHAPTTSVPECNGEHDQAVIREGAKECTACTGEPAASPAALTMDAGEVEFLGARLRRLFNHFQYPLPDWAKDDKLLIGIAPSCIGAVLANLAAQPPAAAEAERDAERYRFIKASMLILSGGHRKFGWPVSPFGEQCDRYLDAAMSASKEGA